MATYYVDPAATGSHSGESWANAWTTLQDAVLTAWAGDAVYCRGTEEITGPVNIDENSGSYDGGYIKFIGCNANGVNDGTRYTLKRVANNINGIDTYATSWIWLENISIEDCPLSGIAVNSTCSNWRLINVRCHNNGGNGINVYGTAQYWSLHKCLFTSNGSSGVGALAQSDVHNCVFAGNSGHGAGNSQSCRWVNCIAHGNTGLGISLKGSSGLLNCVVDGNLGGGIYLDSGAVAALISGCRITNHSIAGKVGVNVQANARVGLLGCYFGNNYTDVTAGRYDIIPVNGATDHVIFNGSDTNHGYVDPDNDDFNLRSDASIRSLGIPLP